MVSIIVEKVQILVKISKDDSASKSENCKQDENTILM